MQTRVNKLEPLTPCSPPSLLATSECIAAAAATRRREIIVVHYLNNAFDYCQRRVSVAALPSRGAVTHTDWRPYLTSSSSCEHHDLLQGFHRAGSPAAAAAAKEELLLLVLHPLILFVPVALGPGRIMCDNVASSNRLVLLNAPLLSALHANTSRDALLPPPRCLSSTLPYVSHLSPAFLNKQRSLSPGRANHRARTHPHQKSSLCCYITHANYQYTKQQLGLETLKP